MKIILAVVLAVMTTAAADAGERDGVLSIGGARVVFTNQSRIVEDRSTIEPIKLSAITSNIAKKYKRGRYWCCAAYEVEGPSNTANHPEIKIAVPFTPARSVTVTMIEVAAGWSGGTNDVLVSLDSDQGGLPGAPIKSWHATGLPDFGTCCALTTVTDDPGVSLTGGTQYWLELSTDSQDADFNGTWNYNDTDQITKSDIYIYCSEDHGGNCFGSSDQWVFAFEKNLAYGIFGPRR